MKDAQRVLALGAHTDDIELGCGATLSRLTREGAAVRCVALSRAEASLPVGSPRDLLEREFEASMAVLGCRDFMVLGYPVRRFSEHRQEILDHLIAILREFDPDVVITHSSRDSHQDHQVLSAETYRASRGRTVLGYASPWNQQNIQTDLFVELSETDIAVKTRMLEQYTSQKELGRGYTSPDYVHSSAVYAGQQSRVLHAESFEVHRIVVKLSDNV